MTNRLLWYRWSIGFDDVPKNGDFPFRTSTQLDQLLKATSDTSGNRKRLCGVPGAARGHEHSMPKFPVRNVKRKLLEKPDWEF